MYHYRVVVTKHWSNGMQTRSTCWLDLIEPYCEEDEEELLDRSNCEPNLDPTPYFYSTIEDVVYLGYAPITPTTNKSIH